MGNGVISYSLRGIEVFLKIPVTIIIRFGEGGVRQQRNDGGGCETKREKLESVESPGTYVTE